VTVGSQNDALKLMNQLIECEKTEDIDSVYTAFDNAGNKDGATKARIETDIPTPPTQRMGNCGLASKLAAIKALCFEEDWNGRTENGESSPTYKGFRDALKAAAESYIQVNEDLSSELQERQEFKRVTKALKEQLEPKTLPQGSAEKGTAIFKAFTTAIDEVKGHANADSELSRLIELLKNEIESFSTSQNMGEEPMDKLEQRINVNQLNSLRNLLVEQTNGETSFNANDFNTKFHELKGQTKQIIDTFDQLAAITTEGVNLEDPGTVQPLMNEFKGVLNSIKNDETFEALRPKIQETSTRIFKALGGKTTGNSFTTNGINANLQKLVFEIHNSTSQQELGEHLGNIDKPSTTYNDLVDLNTKLDSITTAEGMMEFLTKNYGDSKASETPSMDGDTAPKAGTTLRFDSLSKEELNLLLDQMGTIFNQFKGEDDKISLNNKPNGTLLLEEEKTLVRNLLNIYNQLIK
jgi:hypothetical protein